MADPDQQTTSGSNVRLSEPQTQATTGRQSQPQGVSLNVTSEDTMTFPDQSSGQLKTGSDHAKAPLKLENQLTIDKLREFRNQFVEADVERKGSVTMEQFRVALRNTIGDVTDDEADMVFRKVDLFDTGRIQWEEYLSYMMQEAREAHMMHSNSSEPYSRDIRFVKNESHDSIVALMFMPLAQRKKDQTGPLNLVETPNGRYVTLTKDGQMTCFTNNLVKPTSQRVMTPNCPSTQLWVMAAAFMPVDNVVAIATSNCDLLFYGYASGKFERSCRVIQLPGAVSAMSYYCDPFNPKDNQSYLVWGDELGGLCVVVFKRCPSQTRLGSLQQTQEDLRSAERSYLFKDLTNKGVPFVLCRYLTNIHNRVVKQVTYIPQMRSWISCAKDDLTAMFVGDIVEIRPEEKRTYYKIENGATVFTFCASLNTIISGGLDARIRVWNADTSKLVGYLEGHVSPIVQMGINISRKQLVSISENKDLRVHDLETLQCLQTFFRKAFTSQLGFREVSALYVNGVTSRIVLATHTLAMIDVREDDPSQLPLATHNKPVNVVLYNPVFRQVVTADQKSLVCVWDIMNGEKLMQFVAHMAYENSMMVGMEITAMTFDPSYRRLLTAMRDGVMKVWNFNNANCIRQLRRLDAKEVSCVAWGKGRILSSGWNQKVIMYPDRTDQTRPRVMKPVHKDDVCSLDIYPPRYAASGCADGTIMIWSLETTHPLFKYDANDITRKAMANFRLKMLPKKSPTDAKQTSRKTLQTLHSLPSSDDAGVMDDDDDGDEEESGFDYEEGTMPSVPKLDVKWTEEEDEYDIDDDVSESKSPATDQFLTGRKPGVEALLYLRCRRALQENTATLLSCMSDGYVLGWPMDPTGGRCMGRFFSLSAEGESLGSAAVTADNEFLLTGDTRGYVKVWDISHYLTADLSCSEETDRVRWIVWREFPFVRLRFAVDRVNKENLGPLPLHLMQRSTRTATVAPESFDYDDRPPHLINSFRAHLTNISCLEACEVYRRHLIVTGSVDLSVRLWTIEGQFLGIFGQPGMYTDLRPLIAAPMLRRRKSTTLDVGQGQQQTTTKDTASKRPEVEIVVGTGDAAGSASALSKTGSVASQKAAGAARGSSASAAPSKKAASSTAGSIAPTGSSNSVTEGKKEEASKSAADDQPTAAAGKDSSAGTTAVAARASTTSDATGDKAEEKTPTRTRSNSMLQQQPSIHIATSEGSMVAEDTATFDASAALDCCRQARLARVASAERDQRVGRFDPRKESTRVAVVRLNSGKTAGLPSDVRRVASYTTLYVLESGAGYRDGSRWIRVRQAMLWMTAFWKARKMGVSVSASKLVSGEAEKATPYANILRGMIEAYEHTKELVASALSLAIRSESMDDDDDEEEEEGVGEHHGPTGVQHRGKQQHLGGHHRKHRLLSIDTQPLTSEILGKSYDRPFTRKRPPPPMKLPDAIQTECTPYRILPCPKTGDLDACDAALTPSVVDVRDNFHLPDLDCGFRTANKKIDIGRKLLNSLKRTGWVMTRDGKLKRCHQPLNGTSLDPYKSLLPPLYLYDPDSFAKSNFTISTAADEKEESDM